MPKRENFKMKPLQVVFFHITMIKRLKIGYKKYYNQEIIIREKRR